MADRLSEPAALLLSDEEALALAATTTSFWPSPLPTIDLRSEEETLAAIGRGWRSLDIRGLLADGEPDPVALAIPLSACHGVVFARTFLAESGLSPSERGAFTSFIASSRGDDVIVNVASPTGVHAIGKVSLAEARVMFMAAASDVFEKGVGPPNARPLSLCMIGAGSTAAGLSVARGKTIKFTPDNEQRLTPQPASSSLAAPLEAFLSAAFPHP